jgi:hypothetical protein
METIRDSTDLHDVTISVASQRQRRSTLELENDESQLERDTVVTGPDLAYLRIECSRINYSSSQRTLQMGPA